MLYYIVYLSRDFNASMLIWIHQWQVFGQFPTKSPRGTLIQHDMLLCNAACLEIKTQLRDNTDTKIIFKMHFNCAQSTFNSRANMTICKWQENLLCD